MVTAPPQETSLARPYSNVRLFVTKFIVLRKVLERLLRLLSDPVTGYPGALSPLCTAVTPLVFSMQTRGLNIPKRSIRAININL